MPEPSDSGRPGSNPTKADDSKPVDFRSVVRERLPDLGLNPVHEAELVEEVVDWLIDIRSGLLEDGASAIEATKGALDALGDDTDEWRRLDRHAGSMAPAPHPPTWSDRTRSGWSRFGRRVRERLRGAPLGYRIAIVGTSALSLGLAVAVLAIVKAVLLDPLPFPEPDRVLLLANQASELGPGHAIRTTVPSYFDRKENVPAFEELAMFRWVDIALGTNRGMRRVRGTVGTPSLLPTIGVPPLHGRVFDESDAEAGAEQKIILAYDLWQEEFSGDDSIVGTHVPVDGQPFEVVGVMPEGFGIFRLDAQFWIPAVYTAAERADSRRNSSDQYQIGRLRPGATAAEARAQLDALNAANRERFPELREWRDHTGFYVSADPLRDVMVREIRGMLLVISAGSALVVVATIVNLIGLSSSAARRFQGHWSVRVALGARRAHIARRNLSETVPWCLAGGIAGLGVARLVLSILGRYGLDRVPRAASVDIDPGVVLIGVAAAAFMGLVMGLAPVVGIARSGRRLFAAGEPGPVATGGTGFRSFYRTLAAAQIGIAFVIVVTAGLMFAGLGNLLAADTGFQPEGVLTFSYDLPVARYPDADAARQWTETFLERSRRIRGVSRAGATHLLPFSGREHAVTVWPENDPAPASDRNRPSWYSIVSAGYLETLGVRLVEGRLFDELDEQSRDAHTGSVTIVDDVLANRLWPGQTAVGQRVHFALSTDRSTPPHVVVGVVGSIRHQDLAGRERNRAGAAYVLYSDPRHTPRSYTLAVRSEASAESVAREVRAIARDLDPDVPLYEVGAMDARIEGSVASRRFALALVTLFASVAVGLALTGVHGVLAEAAAARRREFGIRMALGSSPRGIVSLVAGEAAILVATGLGVGLASALLARGALGETVVGLGAGEIVVWILSMGLMALASFAALVGPALRVTRIDPVEVLTGE